MLRRTTSMTPSLYSFTLKQPISSVTSYLPFGPGCSPILFRPSSALTDSFSNYIRANSAQNTEIWSLFLPYNLIRFRFFVLFCGYQPVFLPSLGWDRWYSQHVTYLHSLAAFLVLLLFFLSNLYRFALSLPYHHVTWLPLHPGFLLLSCSVIPAS